MGLTLSGFVTGSLRIDHIESATATNNLVFTVSFDPSFKRVYNLHKMICIEKINAVYAICFKHKKQEDQISEGGFMKSKRKQQFSYQACAKAIVGLPMQTQKDLRAVLEILHLMQVNKGILWKRWITTVSESQWLSCLHTLQKAWPLSKSIVSILGLLRKKQALVCPKTLLQTLDGCQNRDVIHMQCVFHRLLSPEEQSCFTIQLREMFQGSMKDKTMPLQLTVAYSVDPDLYGGGILTWTGHLIDFSLKKKITHMKAHLFREPQLFDPFTSIAHSISSDFPADSLSLMDSKRMHHESLSGG